MKTILVMQGIPSSGKSTYAKKFVGDYPSYVRVCRDDLRRMRGKYWVPNQEGMISAWEDHCVEEALKEHNVIIDATNLNPKTISKWEALAHKFGAKIEYHMMETSLEDCVARDALRGDEMVGEKVIHEFYNKYMVYNLKDKKVEKVSQNPDLPKAIIVDLDGTLCIHNGRGPFEYDKCDTDLPNTPVILVVDRFSNRVQNYHVIFLSGREDSCREKTVIWLSTQGFSGFHLYMRKTGDHRKDCIIKKEIFDAEIKDKYYVEFCLDDRKQVVDLWRSMGLTCLQVAEGNF